MSTAPLLVSSSPLCLCMGRWFCFQHGILYDSSVQIEIEIQPLVEDVRRVFGQDERTRPHLVLPAVFQYLSAAVSSSSSLSLASLVADARIFLSHDNTTHPNTSWPATMADAYRLHTELGLRFQLRQPNDDQEEREEGEVHEEKGERRGDEEPLLLRKVYASLSSSFDPTFVRRFLQHAYGLSIAHVAGMAYVQGLSHRAPGFQRELFAEFLRNHTATTSTSTTTSLTKEEIVDLFRFYLMQHDYAPFVVSPERYLEWFYLMQHDYLLSSNLEWMQDHNTIFVNELGSDLWHAYRRSCRRELYRQSPVCIVVEQEESKEEHPCCEDAHTSQEEHEEEDDEGEEGEEGEGERQVNNNVYDAETYMQNDRRGRRGIFTKEEDALLLSLRHQRLAYKDIRAHPLLAKFSIKQLSNRGYKRIRDDVDAPIQRKPKRAHVSEPHVPNEVQGNEVQGNEVQGNENQGNEVQGNEVLALTRLYCDDHALGKTLWRIRRLLQHRHDIWEPDSTSLLQERLLHPIDDASWHAVVAIVHQLCTSKGNQAHRLFVHGLVLVAVDELFQSTITIPFAEVCARVLPKLASFDFDIDRVRQHASERILVHGLLTRLGL